MIVAIALWFWRNTLAAGSLLGKTRTKDVVDAAVAVLSMRHGADVISDDAEDIRRLLAVERAKVSIMDV